MTSGRRRGGTPELWPPPSGHSDLAQAGKRGGRLLPELGDPSSDPDRPPAPACVNVRPGSVARKAPAGILPLALGPAAPSGRPGEPGAPSDSAARRAIAGARAPPSGCGSARRPPRDPAAAEPDPRRRCLCWRTSEANAWDQRPWAFRLAPGPAPREPERLPSSEWVAGPAVTRGSRPLYVDARARWWNSGVPAALGLLASLSAHSMGREGETWSCPRSQGPG